MNTRFMTVWTIKRSMMSIFFAIYLVNVMGCESQNEVTDPRESLTALVDEYWTKRLVDKDYEFTYDLELEKDSLSFSDYVSQVKRSEKFKISSVKTKEVRIDGDRAEVFLSVTCTIPPIPKEVDMGLQDLWILQSNQWKHKFLPVK